VKEEPETLRKTMKFPDPPGGAIRYPAKLGVGPVCEIVKEALPIVYV
jgi:hypothetical protein